MAKSDFNRLTSQDILSAHINGIANAIGNIEQVLNMQTATVEDYELYPIVDIDESEYNYRIYEGDIRGWQTIPAPVIKINGKVAETNSYEIQPAFGVVVFHEQQSSNATITVSCTHIKAGSTRIDDISQVANDALGQAQTNATNISTLDTDMTQAKLDIQDIQTAISTPVEVEIDGYMAGGGELVDGKLVIPQGDVWITNSLVSSPTPALNVTVAVNQIDAFPVYFPHRVIIDKIRIDCGKNNYPSANNIMGIYSTANGLPHRRLAQTEMYNDVLGISEKTFVEGEIKLEAGVYWVVRNSSGSQQYNGIINTDAIPLELPSDMTLNASGGNGIAYGLRADLAVNTTLPLEFPLSTCKALIRSAYANPSLHIKKTYI